MPIRFACPKCGLALAVSSKQSGTLVTCSGCKQPVQVPAAPPRPAGVPRKVRSSAAPRPTAGIKAPADGMRTFWTLCRLLIWGVCLAGIASILLYYASEGGNATRPDEKLLVALQTMVFLLGTYYLAHSFDGGSRNLEELLARHAQTKTGLTAAQTLTSLRRLRPGPRSALSAVGRSDYAFYSLRASEIRFLPR